MRLHISTLLLISFAALSISGQSLTETSYSQARAVLERAVAAYGGSMKLNSIENISIAVGGESVHRNQSRKPGTFDRTPYVGEVVIDLKTSRTYQTQKGHYPGGFNWHQGFVIDAGTRTSFDLIRKTSNVPGTATPAQFRAGNRWLPQLVLLNVLERAESLRYLGKANYENRPHDVIDFVSNDGARFALYIDERSGLLSKFETFITDRFAGDSVLETRFSGQREVNGNIVPTGRVNAVNNDITNDFKVTSVAFNTETAPEKFKIPTGLRAVTFPQPVPVTKHSPTIYTTLAGGYNVLFVDFKDHIFVMEAPGNDRVSQQAVEQIKKTIPGKPIKYLAVTHHHDDHAGGIRAYMAEGSTLIVAPGERDFFQKVSVSKFTAEPDMFTRNPRALNFEPLQNKQRVLTDGITTVEIYDIGPSPHGEEMLVAYLPELKAVYQGDLLNRPSNGDHPIANDTTVHFLRWIDNQKFAVEKIIPVHGTVTTMDELRKAVAEKQNSRN